MPPTQHRKSSKPTSAAGGSGKITNTSSASGSVALQELLLSADGVERQLTFAVDGDLSQKHLQEALQNTQQLVGKLKTEVKRLLTKVADLELSQNASVKKSAENELHTEITKLGSSFQFLFSPFQNPKFDPFSGDHPKPDFGPYDMARYANTSNKELGLVAELYAHVDKRFYSFMIDGDEFGDIFLQAASNARASSVERLKSSASGIFDLGTKKNLFGKDSETTRERIENPRVRTLLGLDLPLEDQVVPPLLYLDEDTADIGKLFLNPLLMKMARIVLYGPSMSEKSNASIRASSPFHGRAKVTPGAIAWCSIVARYLLSSDTELSSSGIGFHSKYDYPGDFENYKMMMILGRNDNRTWYRKLMSTWNKTLFPGKNKGADNDSEEDPAVRSGVIGSNAVTDLMQRMKIAGSNVIPKSDSDSESSESESSESDLEVVPQHKSRPSTSTIEIEDSDSNDEHTIPHAHMSKLPQPQPQPRPRPQLRLTITKNPMVFDDNDSHTISYAAPLPPPPQPRLSTTKTSAADVINDPRIISYATPLPPPPQQLSTTKTPMVVNDDSRIISDATLLPPQPQPRPSTQNLRTDNNIPRISTPAHLEAPPPELDSESLRQAHVHDPPDSPLSELADMEPIIPLTQPTALAQNSKVGKKSKTKKQSEQVPGPTRRSGRSKSGLNAANEGVDKKGKGRSRHSGN